MTEQEISEIEARANAATPGPWHVSRTARLIEIKCRADAIFIKHASRDVPALVAEVRRLRQALEKAEAERDVVDR